MTRSSAYSSSHGSPSLPSLHQSQQWRKVDFILSPGAPCLHLKADAVSMLWSHHMLTSLYSASTGLTSPLPLPISSWHTPSLPLVQCPVPSPGQQRLSTASSWPDVLHAVVTRWRWHLSPHSLARSWQEAKLYGPVRTTFYLNTGTRMLFFQLVTMQYPCMMLLNSFVIHSTPSSPTSFIISETTPAGPAAFPILPQHLPLQTHNNHFQIN